jgi:hypothetical protein
LIFVWCVLLEKYISNERVKNGEENYTSQECWKWEQTQISHIFEKNMCKITSK